MVSLEGSHFFHGHNVAFENINALKNGELPNDLYSFLKENLPEHNKNTLKLVIQDKNMAGLLNDKLKLKCVSGENYLEVFRGIR